MSAETTGSPVTEAPKQESVSPLEASLRAVWNPGTPLTRKVAEKIAREHKISASAVYKLRKKLSVSALSTPANPIEEATSQEAPRSEAQEAGLDVVAVPKPKMLNESGGAASPLLTNDRWTKDELSPIFEAANGLLESFGIATPEELPKPEVTDQLADLYAQCFNAFEVPKGKEGGKAMLVVSTGALTLAAYFPVIHKVLPGKKRTQKESEKSRDTTPSTTTS